MLTSRQLLRQFWHDDRNDIRKVDVWYTDPGAPDEISMAAGPDISPEPDYRKSGRLPAENSFPINGSWSSRTTGVLF